MLDNVLNRIVALNLGQGPARSVIGTLPPRPFPAFVSRGEGGLHGIALDTGFNRVLTIGITQTNQNGVAQFGVVGVDLNSGANGVLLTNTSSGLRGLAVDNTTRSAFFAAATSPATVSTASLNDPLMFVPSVVAQWVAADAAKQAGGRLGGQASVRY